MRQVSHTIQIEDAVLTAIEVEVTAPPIYILAGEKGFVGCGYFSSKIGNKAGHAVAMVAGVYSWDDILNKDVTEVSNKAAALGVKVGMKGCEAAVLLA
jgi:uncharacterized protein YunC (DUF1805 family)